MKSLSTPRLQLEQVDERNAAALWRVMQSAHLREFQDVPRIAREDFVRRVAARPRTFDGRAHGRFEWLVHATGRPEPIGWVSLRIGEHSNGGAEIGYSLIVSGRGNGFAREAAAAVVAAAFTTGLAHLEACCVPANAASRRLLEAIGFAQTHVQSNGAVVRGRPVDICIYRLPRSAWEEHTAQTAGTATARQRTRS